MSIYFTTIPHTQEAEVGELSQVPSQPRLHSQFQISLSLSQGSLPSSWSTQGPPPGAWVLGFSSEASPTQLKVGQPGEVGVPPMRALCFQGLGWSLGSACTGPGLCSGAGSHECRKLPLL